MLQLIYLLVLTWTLAQAKTIKADLNLPPTWREAKATPLEIVQGATVSRKNKIFALKMVKICFRLTVRTINFDFVAKTVENLVNGTLRSGNNNGKS